MVICVSMKGWLLDGLVGRLVGLPFLIQLNGTCLEVWCHDLSHHFEGGDGGIEWDGRRCIPVFHMIRFRIRLFVVVLFLLPDFDDIDIIL